MKPRIGFYGWSFVDIMNAAYEKAAREGMVITGIDVGRPGGDHSAVTMVIIDDPYMEAHTYEGEFQVVHPREAMSQMAKMIEHEKLPAARSTEKNKGPQPRTRYPRRR
jgi:hypothetical protein